MSDTFRMDLTELPKHPTDQSPAGLHSAILDAAAEMGKIQPEELSFGHGMTLAMVYGMVRSITEDVRKRRLK